MQRLSGNLMKSALKISFELDLIQIYYLHVWDLFWLFSHGEDDLYALCIPSVFIVLRRTT